MQIEGSIALVTGADRGLGAALAEALLARGAAKVYAAADHRLGHGPAADAVRLDLTDAPRSPPLRSSRGT